MPFIEMPQREEASPSMTSSPPLPVAPADWTALPFTHTTPDIMFSATPDAGMAVDGDLGLLVHAAAIEADMALDVDGSGASRPQAMACWPIGFLIDPVALVESFGTL